MPAGLDSAQQEARRKRTETRLAEMEAGKTAHIRPSKLAPICSRSGAGQPSDTETLLPGMATKEAAPVRVGLKVDPSTRGLVAAVDRPGQQHSNKARADAARVPLWMTIENPMAWEWFCELDDDASGVLDREEAKALCVKLKLKIKKFDQVFEELDEDGSGTVAFGEFVSWFNERKTAERREMRLAVRELFDKMDKDRSGKLDIKEIGTLVKKSKHTLNLIGPPFDVEADWTAMRKTGQDEFGEGGEVTFPHFEDWWKDRSGIVDVSIPVLPDFVNTRIVKCR